MAHPTWAFFGQCEVALLSSNPIPHTGTSAATAATGLRRLFLCFCFSRRCSETRCSCCRGRPPVLLRVLGGSAVCAGLRTSQDLGPHDLTRARDGVGGAETGPATFLDPGGRSREAQRSGFSPWKRSFCSSGQDKNKTVSCRGQRQRVLTVRSFANETCRWQALAIAYKRRSRWQTLPDREGRRKPSWRTAWSVGADGKVKPSWRREWSVGPMEGSNQAGAGNGPLGRWKGQTKLAQGMVRWIDGRVKPGWRTAWSVGPMEKGQTARSLALVGGGAL
jgi:hypothetical protein